MYSWGNLHQQEEDEVLVHAGVAAVFLAIQSNSFAARGKHGELNKVQTKCTGAAMHPEDAKVSTTPRREVIVLYLYLHLKSVLTRRLTEDEWKGGGGEKGGVVLTSER